METSGTSRAGDNAKRECRFFSWRTVGYLLVGLAGLVTLVGLFFVEEDWRGKHAWENYKREAEARGVELDFLKLTPTPVPDEQNFAMTPFLAPLFDFNPKPLKPGQSAWRDETGHDRAINFATNMNFSFGTNRPTSVIGSGHLLDLESLARALAKKQGGKGAVASRSAAAELVLANFQQYEPVLSEIEAASHRPSARFNVGYDDEDPAGILLPHLAVMKRLVVILQIEASANLALRRTDTAMAKLKLIFYLGDVMQNEPFLISHLVRLAVLNINRQIVWEGLAQGNWSEAQLRELQTRLSGEDVAKGAKHALMSERAGFGAREFDYLRKNPAALNTLGSGDGGQGQGTLGSAFVFVPNGWLYLEEISCQRIYDGKVLPGFDPETGRVDPREIDKNFANVGEKVGFGSAFFVHHDLLASLFIPALGNYYRKVAIAETGLNESVIACALERYRLANGKLPPTLDALMPQFLDKVPLDVVNGLPLVYKPGSEKDFILYSVGWNGTDDGGITVMKKGPTAAAEPLEGDWVWPEYEGN